MSMIIIQFIVSALVIVLAGTFLTKAADKIAETSGWGKMFVGSLLLAGATSFPELIVDIKSIKMNLPDFAVGDLLGSSLFNLLILSVLDFAFPSKFRRTTFSPAYFHHALTAVVTIVLTSLSGLALIAKIDVSFLSINLFSWLTLIFYLIALQLIHQGNEELPSGDRREKTPLLKNRSFLLATGGYLFSAVIIVMAAPFLVESADNIARMSGLGHSFIGTTLMAFSTSLPELVATMAAFRMGAPDLALGNIFGSNAFNMILFLPLDFFFSGDLFKHANSIHGITAFAVIISTAIVVMGQISRKKEKQRKLWEPSSEIVVLVILANLYLLYKIKGA